MAHREFTDSNGHTWDVWDVHPTTAMQQLAGLYPHARPHPVDLATVSANPCKAVAPAFEAGWLCFGQGAERRRLAPIPADWEQLSSDALERLRDCAARVTTAAERQRRGEALAGDAATAQVAGFSRP